MLIILFVMWLLHYFWRSYFDCIGGWEDAKMFGVLCQSVIFWFLALDVSGVVQVYRSLGLWDCFNYLNFVVSIGMDFEYVWHFPCIMLPRWQSILLLHVFIVMVMHNAMSDSDIAVAYDIYLLQRIILMILPITVWILVICFFMAVYLMTVNIWRGNYYWFAVCFCFFSLYIGPIRYVLESDIDLSFYFTITRIRDGES